VKSVTRRVKPRLKVGIALIDHKKIRVGLRRIADSTGQFEARFVSSLLTRRSTVDPQLTLLAA
jgi:hypothetical protein